MLSVVSWKMRWCLRVDAVEGLWMHKIVEFVGSWLMLCVFSRKVRWCLKVNAVEGFWIHKIGEFVSSWLMLSVFSRRMRWCLKVNAVEGFWIHKIVEFVRSWLMLCVVSRKMRWCLRVNAVEGFWIHKIGEFVENVECCFEKGPHMCACIKCTGNQGHLNPRTCWVRGECRVWFRERFTNVRSRKVHRQSRTSESTNLLSSWMTFRAMTRKFTHVWAHMQKCTVGGRSCALIPTGKQSAWTPAHPHGLWESMHMDALLWEWEHINTRSHGRSCALGIRAQERPCMCSDSQSTCASYSCVYVKRLMCASYFCICVSHVCKLLLYTSCVCKLLLHVCRADVSCICVVHKCETSHVCQLLLHMCVTCVQVTFIYVLCVQTTFAYVSCICVINISYVHVTLADMWNISFTCVAHICGWMTRSCMWRTRIYVWHDVSIHVTWCIHARDMTHFTNMTWLMHTWYTLTWRF